MADMIEGIEQALAQGKILTVKDVVHVYETRINEMGRSDERTYSSKRKWMKKHIEKNVSNIKFESTLGNNSSQQIISTDLNSLILSLAEKKSLEDDETDVEALRRAAKIFESTLPQS